jgi:hypothetical protein
MKKLIFIMMLMTTVAAQAADGQMLTRSVGKYRADDSQTVDRLLSTRDVIALDGATRKRLMHSGSELSPEMSARPTAQHAAPVVFEIFDAWVELEGDVDRDGYFHRLNVVFDADVNTALETVYVKLYLSRDGGDWVHYTSSDLFEIRYDAVDDTYEVVTELVDGYVPGYYDVLIELHAMNHGGIVASRMLQQDEHGYLISLEDSVYDDPYYLDSVTTVETTTVHGAGSLSLEGMFLYALLVLIKLRYFPSQRKSRA